MKVLLVGPGFAMPGGIQYVGHLIAEGLLTLFGSELRLEVCSFLDGPEPRLKVPLDSWSGCNGNRIQFVRSLRRHVRRSPDVILLNHVHQLPYLALATTGVATNELAVVMHGIEAWRPLSKTRRLGLGRVTRMVYVSDFTRRRALEASPELSKIEGMVCHHGLLPENDAASSQVANTPAASPPFVLMIGRMSSEERYKGYEEVIRAWPRVRELRPDLELVLVGNGDDRPRLEAIAAGSKAIRFTGQIGDVERDRLIRECVAFALPSRGEGFGLVYLEAMRAGKPVIAGSLDAGCEVIVDGVTGRAVDPREEDQLVRALVETTSAEGARMGEAGRRRFLEKFTFESYTARLRTVVESRPGKSAPTFSSASPP
jgi:phosphatidyl-myo-inositol dimannoside synthase